MNRLQRCICLVVLTAAVVLGQEPGPKINPHYSEYFVLAPTQLQLQCSIQGSGQRTLEWFKDEQPLTNSHVIATFTGQATSGNITITNTSFVNSGMYKCQVKDPMQSVLQQVTFFKVEVTNATYVTKAESLMMQCMPEFQGSNPVFSMTWQKNNTPVVEDEKFKIHSENYTLELIKPGFDDIGVYQCVFKFQSTPTNQTWVVDVNILAHPKVKKFDLSKNLIQEERLELNCEAKGNPMPTVRWLKDGEDLQPTERLSFEPHNNMKDAKLIIGSVDYSDRGEYMCLAHSTLDNSTANSTVYIRVKDKLAALWPFLGIVAEVFILCVIIFIYERRRAKHEEDEDDVAAGAGSATVDHKANDEVRQRNVRT